MARPVGRLERHLALGGGGTRWSRVWWRRFDRRCGRLRATFTQWRRAEAERRRAETQRDLALKERALAERNFHQAREAVNTYLTQVSDSDVLKAQNLEPLRRELLRTARDFYEQFLEQNPDDRHLQAELGKAHERLGLITSALESKPNALGHYQKMRAIFERLHEAYPLDPSYQRELAESCFREAESMRAGIAPHPLIEASYLRARAVAGSARS